MAFHYYIENLDGILYSKNKKLLKFEISNGVLKNYKLFTRIEGLPAHMINGVSYETIRAFFEDRVVEYGSMHFMEYIHGIGLDKYDFEQIIKKNNGWNHLDTFWLKMDIGAKSWEEICNQNYPIY